jgi:hypothetical protein
MLIFQNNLLKNALLFLLGLGWILPLKTDAQTSGRGNMLVGDGTDDKVDVGNVSVFDFERTSSFTIETWFRASNGTGAIFTKGQVLPTPTAGYGLFFQNRRLAFTLNNTAIFNQLILQSTTQFNLNEWYHVACSYDGSSLASGIKVYLNGVLLTMSLLTANTLSASIITSEPVFLGASLAGNQDETRIWAGVRTQAQIRENMHLVLSGSEAGLLAYYPFNESSGAVIDVVGGVNGTLIDNAARLSSTVSVAQGSSTRQTINQIVHPTTSTETLGNLQIRFTSMSTPATNDEFVAYQLSEPPLNTPSGVTFSSNYWLIRRFGTQAFTYDQMTFTIPSTNRIAAEEETGQPGIANLKLFKRNTNSAASNWGSEIGTAIEASNTTKLIKYALLPEQSSFSEFLPSSGGSSPLPIILLNFEAQRLANQLVILKWQTASESNNKGFVIEKSDNGQDFAKLAWVDGKTNTSDIQSYRYTTSEPASTYYRLQPVDWDGKFSYSPIRFVAAGAQVSDLNVSPNPFISKQDKIRLAFGKAGANETLHLILYNTQGKVCWESRGKLLDLENKFNEKLPSLEQGILLLRLRSQVGVFEQKILHY